MVASTLALLQNWYTEPTQGNDRPKLLSKLATLEFCGWLEHWMDDFINELAQHSVCSTQWVEADVIGKTSGFDYGSHLRPMLCKLLGEHQVLVGESRFMAQHPSELEQIKSVLGMMWKIRCSFAHSDLQHNVIAQATFNAPSWTASQHRSLERKLLNMKAIFLVLASSMPAA